MTEQMKSKIIDAMLELNVLKAALDRIDIFDGKAKEADEGIAVIERRGEEIRP